MAATPRYGGAFIFAGLVVIILVLIRRSALLSVREEASLRHRTWIGCEPFHSAGSMREWARLVTKEAGIAFSDKFEWHDYAVPYMKYLNEMRCKPVRMLEMGLGDAKRTGTSLAFWRRFFGKQAIIHAFDADSRREDELEARMPGVVDAFHRGSLGNDEDLKGLIARGGGDYDVVIDAGRHDQTDQMRAFAALFAHVKPGGVYIIEDVFTFYSHKYGGGAGRRTMLSFITELLEDQWRLAVPADTRPGDLHHAALSRAIRGVDCMREVCIITKHAPSEWDATYSDCIGTTACDCGEFKARCLPR